MKEILYPIALVLGWIVVAFVVGMAGLWLFGLAIGPTEEVDVTIGSGESGLQNPARNTFAKDFTVTTTDGDTFDVTEADFDDLEAGGTYSCEAKGVSFLFLHRSLGSCELTGRSPARAAAPAATVGIGPAGVDEGRPASNPTKRRHQVLRCFGENARERVSSIYLSQSVDRCLTVGEAVAFHGCLATKGDPGAAKNVQGCLDAALAKG